MAEPGTQVHQNGDYPVAFAQSQEDSQTGEGRGGKTLDI